MQIFTQVGTVTHDALHDPNRRPDYYQRRIQSEEYRAERPEKAELILSICGVEIGQADRALEVGCGTGIIADELERRLGTPVYRIDLYQAVIERRNHAVAGSAVCLPLRDASVGVVICNHLYEHVSDRPSLFQELYRVLKPGGICYVAAGNKWAVIEPHYRLPFLSWLPRSIASRYIRVTGRGETYEGIDFSSYWQLTEWMVRAGFDVEDRTERFVDSNIDSELAAFWVTLWKVFGKLPASLRRLTLRAFCPQWRLIGVKSE